MGRCILALDQSSKITGYAIFNNGALVKYGHFTCNDNDFSLRLMHIREHVEGLIDQYNISEMIIEDIQLQEGVGNNVATFKKLAEVYGVITELAQELDVKCSSVLATQWKFGLHFRTHHREDQKKEAQELVKTAFGEAVTSDEADAICIGIYYLSDKIYEKNTSTSAAFDWT